MDGLQMLKKLLYSSTSLDMGNEDRFDKKLKRKI
jgi:hypothetical protein